MPGRLHENMLLHVGAKPMKIVVDQRVAAQIDSGFETTSVGETELNPGTPEEVFAIELATLQDREQR